MLTSKPLPDSLVANEAAVSVVQVTFSQSLINGAQVQVDSISIYAGIYSNMYA